MALGVTAFLAGLTGTWSPCGLSTVETLGSAMGRGARRRTVLAAAVAFALAALAGGLATFGGAALAGAALGFDGSMVPAALLVVVAVACAVGDWRFARVVPQIPAQVPERARWRLPLAVTGVLYGWLLGLGFTTYLLSYAMWALLAGALLLGEPGLGLATGVAFGAGRALPVLVLAPTYGAESTQAFLTDMAQRPLLAGLRRLDGAVLLVAAVLVVPVAGAAAAEAPPAPASDPSVSGSDLVFQRDGHGLLQRGDAAAITLPGTHPAVGGGWIIWHDGATVTLARRDTLTTVVTFPLPGVDALAVGSRWLAYRTTSPQGRQIVGAARLNASGLPTTFYAPRAITTHLSRPSVWGDMLALGVAGPHHSRVVVVNLRTGGHRTVRRAGYGEQLSAPSLRDGRLLYVRATRCVQELRLGRVDRAARHDRVLLRTRSITIRDRGYQRGYTRAYNGASLCRGLPTSSLRGILWTTALGPDAAYVTRLPADARGHPRISSMSR